MLSDDLLIELEKIPAIDVHSHLNRDALAVAHPSEFMLYHMLLYELCAAGGSDRVVAPWHGPEGDPDEAMAQFLPYYPRIASTGFGWCLKTILRDLYEFDDPITPDSYPRLRDAVDRKVRQPDWALQVLRRGNIVRTLTSRRNVKPLVPNQPDPGLRFTFESLPFGTLNWHAGSMKEGLVELETAQGQRIGSGETLRDALSQWFEKANLSESKALVAWIGGRMDTEARSAAEIASLFNKVRTATPLSAAEQACFEAVFFKAIIGAIQGKTRVFQYVLGCINFNTRGQVRLPIADGDVDLGAHVGRLMVQFPDLQLDVLNGYEPAEPVLCSVAARLPNLSLSSMWWHMFYPHVAKNAWQRRIDMVPETGLCGFFSDGYCVDWQYARLKLTQRVLANALAERIEAGWMTQTQALTFARFILHDNPLRIFLPDEKL